MAKYSHITRGGVGAPVGLTVFKTAGGSLGAVPGGFDSHTPLPHRLLSYHCMPSVTSIVSVELTLILFLAWKKYAGPFEIIYANCRKIGENSFTHAHVNHQKEKKPACLCPL